jgi:hypothetical protein
MRRRFSFALLPAARCRTSCRPLDVGPAAGRSMSDQLPAARCRTSCRPLDVGTSCRPLDVGPAAGRSMSDQLPAARCRTAYRVKPASSRRQKSPPAGHGRRALWPTAWAMFQTNNTPVFPIGPNCPIIPRKVAYIFVRGPYDQTRRPVGRGA